MERLVRNGNPLNGASRGKGVRAGGLNGSNNLGDEPDDGIGHLESLRSDFDRLESDTGLLHNTKRRPQP
ncbi:MAG: hypothetical protein ACR2PF_17855 [Rhizobiaceae bacterium]